MNLHSVKQAKMRMREEPMLNSPIKTSVFVCNLKVNSTSGTSTNNSSMKNTVIANKQSRIKDVIINDPQQTPSW